MTNQGINSLLNHRSIRKFKPDPVPDETIDLILQAGTRAASAGNLQAYSFAVVDKPALVKKLGSSAPIAVVALVDQYRLKRWFELHDAPFCNDRAINLFISYWDAVIALQNVVVAAESLVLGAQSMWGGDDPLHKRAGGLGCPGVRLPLRARVHRLSG